MEDFEEIYLANATGIYRFLYKLTANAPLSEELTQECFFRAWRSFHRYNGSCDLFTWLAAIAKNLYFEQCRKDKHLVFNDELLLDIEHPDGEPDNHLLGSERAEAVRNAITHLPKSYRDVVVLRIYAELKFSQIATLLGISEPSAKVLFFRAKSKLKEELSHVCL